MQGDFRAEYYIKNFSKTLDKYFDEGSEKTDIYNRAYETIVNVLRDCDKEKQKIS